MENYFASFKKYNKIIYKYMDYAEGEIDYKLFTPEHPVCGFEILRWVMHKISHNPREGYKIRILLSMKDEDSEIFIQEWYDPTKLDGYVNVVHHKESCIFKKEATDKEVYKNELLQISHRVVYNACVDYIIKTT